jgi:hypothetical protein
LSGCIEYGFPLVFGPVGMLTFLKGRNEGQPWYLLIRRI